MENFPFSSSILLWCIWTRITVLNSRSYKVRCKGFKFSFIILEAFDRTIRLIFYQSFKLKKHWRHLEKLSTKMRKYLAPVVERVGSGPYKSAWINSSKWEALDVYGVNGSLWLLASLGQKNCLVLLLLVLLVLLLQEMLQETWICFKTGTVGWPSHRCHLENSFVDWMVNARWFNEENVEEGLTMGNL